MQMHVADTDDGFRPSVGPSSSLLIPPAAPAPAPAPAPPAAAASRPVSDLYHSCSNLQVEYASQDVATIVMTALAVDSELQPDKVTREITVNGQILVVTFVAVEARCLRAAFSAFMDVLVLATKTIEEFGHSPVLGC